VIGPAIQVESLSKHYRIGERRGGYRTVRETLMDAALRPLRAARGGRAADRAPRDTTVWALRDVSFEIAAGEVVGIVGRNGAGKSTLLKVLSRITEPTSGCATIQGRVGSLLEVGTGFHPELTGRENIYLNGAILGMPKRDIGRKFDEIVAFAEVERFIDTPVKHYSSGMHLRLAFAVAAHLEPDVLLVDEVLAVGDVAFQEKCLGKMQHVARSGRTVLLVSHNMAAISALCERTVFLHAGELAFHGDTETAIKRYIADAASRSAIDLTERRDREGDGRVRLQQVRLVDEIGHPTDIVQSGRQVDFFLDYAAADARPVTNALFEIKVTDHIDQLLFTLSTFLTGESFPVLPRTGTIRCRVPALLLAPGTYNLRLICYVNNELADLVRDARRFTVAEGDFYGGGKLVRAKTYGPVLMPQHWACTDDESALATDAVR
jgi:lipopolysaccharide transport system ATP-binding protein